MIEFWWQGPGYVSRLFYLPIYPNRSIHLYPSIYSSVSSKSSSFIKLENTFMNISKLFSPSSAKCRLDIWLNSHVHLWNCIPYQIESPVGNGCSRVSQFGFFGWFLCPSVLGEEFVCHPGITPHIKQGNTVYLAQTAAPWEPKWTQHLNESSQHAMVYKADAVLRSNKILGTLRFFMNVFFLSPPVSLAILKIRNVWRHPVPILNLAVLNLKNKEGTIDMHFFRRFVNRLGPKAPRIHGRNVSIYQPQTLDSRHPGWTRKSDSPKAPVLGFSSGFMIWHQTPRQLNLLI